MFNVPITDLDTLRAAGICWPHTVDSWRWLYRHRDTNGFAPAFTKRGGRVQVIVPVFRDIAAKQRGAA